MEIILWKILRDKNMRVLDLVDLTGMSKNTLYRIQNGQKSPTMDEIELIAKALNVSISQLCISEYL